MLDNLLPVYFLLKQGHNILSNVFINFQVQNLIERCLQLYMNQKEVVDTLSFQAKIEPSFTELGNFTAYHLYLLRFTTLIISY